jgi:hypothetical protein
LPDLRGLLAIPPPSEQVLSFIKVGRNMHLVHDAPLWNILSKSRVPTHSGVEFGAFGTNTMSLGRGRSTASTIAVYLCVPGITVATARLITGHWSQRRSALCKCIITDLATWNGITSPLTAHWPCAGRDLCHGKLEGGAIGVYNERGVTSELQRCTLEALLRNAIAFLAQPVVVAASMVGSDGPSNLNG